MTRSAALLLLASLALYAPTLDHFFVSDDFLNFERNGFRTAADALGLFSTKDIDFYRPIPRLHFGLLQGLVGDRVLVWNLVGVLLHALTSWVAVLLAASLMGPRRRAARYTGLFFCVHFIHVEAVVWASSVTTLYVTLFVLLALLFFRRARSTGSGRERLVSVVSFAAALASKETAIAFVPLLLLTTWWWPVSNGRARASRLPTLREALPYAILLAAYAVVAAGIDRGGEVSPYRIGVGAHVLKNAVFFVLAGFLPLRYWQIRDAGRDVGGLSELAATIAGQPLVAAVIAAGIVGLGLAWWRGGRDVRGGLLWIFAAATPFLFLPGSGERFVYLPSFGASLVLGVGAGTLLRRPDSVPGGKWTTRSIVAVVLALHVAGNLDRQADWTTAAKWTRGITSRWVFFRTRDAEQPIEFAGIPDAYRSAWVFRNGFDSMVRLYWEGRPYGRAGEMPPGASAPERIEVLCDENGTVGMIPARPLPRP